MNKIFRLVILSCSAALISACGNNTDTTSAKSALTSGVTHTPSANSLSADAYIPIAKSNDASAASSPLKARNLSASPSPAVIKLATPTKAQLAQAQQQGHANTSKLAKRVQVGFSRTVVQTSTASGTHTLLNWAGTATGGKVAAISFTSSDAKNLRLGLLVTQLPETATLRFYAQGALQAHEFSGKEIIEVLAKNLAAGDKTDAGRTYWGPVIEGAESTIEIELPVGVSTTSVQVAFPKLAHAFISTETASQSIATPQTATFNGAAICQVSITCTTPLPAVSDAVMKISFVDPADGLQYNCSATYINDNISSGTMYVLTANHCIDNQTAASSVSPLMFYRSSCDGTSSSGTGYGPRASLLFTSFNTDTSLLKFYPNEYGYNPLNSGAILAGWDATAPAAINTPVTGIHHPKGDAQRISSGTVTNNMVRDAVGDFDYSTQSAGTFLEVTLTNGIVDFGSSGSALFKDFNTNPKVIGQLTAGLTAVCTSNTSNSPQRTAYGRFDKAYTAGLSDWLSHGLKPVYRFYNNLRGTHFFSQSITEKNFISANYPQFSYENAVFNAYSNVDTAITPTRSPVYRFYNSATQSHFYTISASERDMVNGNIASGAWPQYAFEGTSWYAKTPAQNASAPDGTTPLYRFYRTNGTHFFTASLAEKNSIEANLSAYYTYEGIAYYVWPLN